MSFALRLAEYRIRVNSVAPAMVDTDFWDVVDGQLAERDDLQPGEAKKRRIDQIPLGRAGTAEDVAYAVAYLATDDSAWVTGECMHLTGGVYMH
jgi:D-sorbitol dehydrogenase (acceptor)